MKSLYRKYRPLKLGDVVGQEQVTGPLTNALKAGKISHAYLFTGPRGTGKTSVARIFAHEINDFKYDLEDDYTDIIEIDGASNRGVDNIREIREKAAIAPTEGKYKVYIIDEVHMLTKEAFNALLKTLEEPPEHVIFIMATTDAYKVPVTITSRAQTYTFKLAERETIFNHLKNVASQEKIPISDEALKIIVRRGGGSFRDSLSLLDQISALADTENNTEISKEMVEKTMGLPEGEKIQEIILEYTSGNVVKITTLLKDLYNSGVKAEIITEEMIRSILDNPKAELLLLLNKLTNVKAPFTEAKLLISLCANISAGENTNSAPGKTAGRTFNNKTTNAIKETSGDTLGGAAAQGSSKDITTPAQEITTAAAPTNTINEVVSGSINTAPTTAVSGFDWNAFLNKIQGLNDAIYMQLKGARWAEAGGRLMIQPAKSFSKVILNKTDNLRVLREVAGKEVQVGDLSELSGAFNTENGNVEKKSALNSKISDIMGGEVEEYGGGSPF